MQDAFRGGCSPRLNRCKVDCAHRRMITEYRVERHRQELEEQAATLGYETELRLRRESGLAPITFKQWITGLRATDDEPESATRDDQRAVDDAHATAHW